MHFSSKPASCANPLSLSNYRHFIRFYPLHSLHSLHSCTSNIQLYNVQKMCKNVQRENPFHFIQVPAGVKT